MTERAGSAAADSVTAALRQYQARMQDRLLSVVEEARRRVPEVAARVGGGAVAGLDAFSAVPVLAKDDVPALQDAAPPFGGMVAPDATVHRVFASPGPIYEPQLDGGDPWRWAPALQACGIGSGDVVLNCFSYHLSPAGTMFDEACRSVGATVVPAGVGAAEVQVRVIADAGVTAFIGLPSYLAALVDRYDGQGLERARWQLGKALVTAEPLPDELRARLRERVPTVLMAYGTAETGLLGFETEAGGGLALPDDVYLEVCEPDTGVPVVDDTPGEVVVTVLHPAYPLLRLGTGDVSRWTVGPYADLRLAGVLGRVGAAVKVRGMFIHPHQARAVVDALVADGLVEAARFVVDRDGDRDVLRCEVKVNDDLATAAVSARVVGRVRDDLRVTPVVVPLQEPVDDTVLVDARTWD